MDRKKIQDQMRNGFSELAPDIFDQIKNAPLPDCLVLEEETKTTKKSGDSVGAAQKNNNKEQAEEPQKKEITVSFSISCKNAVAYGSENAPKSGYFIRPEEYTGKNGITVFDVLEAECKSHGIELTYKDKYYIQGIGGLAEKQCGGGSGWMYRVNGVAPHKAAVGYYLKDGDVVEWYYVTNINDN